jgi:hypothetical protein
MHVHKHITVQKTENPNIKIAISTISKTRQEYKGSPSTVQTRKELNRQNYKFTRCLM